MPLTSTLLGQSFHTGGFDLTHSLAIQTLVNENSVVLDIGNGACGSAKYLADRFDAQVYAVEHEMNYLQDANSSNHGHHADNVHFLQGQAEHLPIANDSVDVVFCEGTMSTFKRREKVLAEIYRVLKGRGFLAISDIFLNATSGQKIGEEFNRLLGVNSFFNAVRCEEVVSQSGFYQSRFKDVSSQLLETVHSVESKLTVPDPLMKQQLDAQAKQQQADWQQQLPSRLAQMIYDGDAGYYTLTARKPG